MEGRPSRAPWSKWLTSLRLRFLLSEIGIMIEATPKRPGECLTRQRMCLHWRFKKEERKRSKAEDVDVVYVKFRAGVRECVALRDCL